LRDCIEELEEEKRHMEEHMNQKVSALEKMFQDQMSELMKRLAEKNAESGNNANVVDNAEETMDATNIAHSRPGAVGTGAKEGSTSAAAGDNGAPASEK
jgi:peptidoglycan hydrolase CwlO-like protein